VLVGDNTTFLFFISQYAKYNQLIGKQNRLKRQEHKPANGKLLVLFLAANTVNESMVNMLINKNGATR